LKGHESNLGIVVTIVLWPNVNQLANLCVNPPHRQLSPLLHHTTSSISSPSSAKIARRSSRAPSCSPIA
ncbi:MAG: hypothetical protein ACKN89_06205, partial [Cyanobium sp.]